MIKMHKSFNYMVFTIPHTRDCYEVLLNSWEILVKELFFNKISALQPANAIKTKFFASSFQGFCLVLGTANLRNNSFLLTG